jgi:hypothetical protein
VICYWESLVIPLRILGVGTVLRCIALLPLCLRLRSLSIGRRYIARLIVLWFGGNYLGMLIALLSPKRKLRK